MRRSFVRDIFIAGIVALSFFSACSIANKVFNTQASVESRSALAEGDFQNALNGFKAAYKKNPRGKELMAKYVGTVEEIRRAADLALSRQDYARAARIYRILLSNYADFEPFAAKLTFKKAYLDVTLKYCRIALADAQAGEDMKAGNFAEALDGYQAALKEYPADVGLAGRYLQTVEEIKGAADRALGQREYARAGTIYRVLLNSYDGFGALAPKLSFNKAQLETALKNCRTVLVDNPVHQALKAGNFARALEVHQAALKENPGDADLAAKYRTTLNDIKAAGDKAFASKDFAKAGSVNVLLLKNFPSFEGLRPPVAFSRGTLREVIAVCRDGLTKAGLEEYRKGNLVEAIAVWEDLLAFDPDNAEIKKAVNTVRTQLNEIIKKN